MKNNHQDVWYSNDAVVTKFLMGGLGTGNISIGVRGNLCDFEIFNRPFINGRLPYTFFAVRTEDEEKNISAKALEAQMNYRIEKSHGIDPFVEGGVPRFKESRLNGKISRALVELRDDTFPLEADLEAFSPFIPLNVKDSGIPAFLLRYTLRNTSSKSQHVSLAGSLANASGFTGKYNRFRKFICEGEQRNTYKEEKAFKGIYMDNATLPCDSLNNGSMAISTTSKDNVSYKKEWIKEEWIGNVQDFWNDFMADGKLQEGRKHGIGSDEGKDSTFTIGSLCVDFDLEPKEEKTVEFVLSWYFPNRVNGWNGYMMPHSTTQTRNLYALSYKNAWDVQNYFIDNLKELESQTKRFEEAYYSTTIPSLMLDKAANNITVIRSNTCWIREDGTFFGWEGTFNDEGCCEGNCNHVWNYEQTLAFLFPELERNMRVTNFLYETEEDGKMEYRSNKPMTNENYTGFLSATDGQLGAIIQFYRDWKLSGDDDFLKKLWPNVKKALEYSFTEWDKDGDGVLECAQHNTFDIEFYGFSTLTSGMYLTALKACRIMAEYLGENDKATQYKEIFEKGSKKLDEACFNGEYYEQILAEPEKYNWQYMSGCLTEQLFPQELSSLFQLGYILPQEHVRKTLQSIMHYNYRKDFSNLLNIQRAYCINDEHGLIECSWPKGARPEFPFPYSDEVWTGSEYHMAANMIMEGYLDEANELIEGLDGRYDGVKRNPFNEVECGNHYVRSMASWGLILASSGFGFDMTKGEISFNPAYNKDDFKTIFTTGKCWGIYTQKKDKDGNLMKNIEVLYGDPESVHLI